MGWLDAPTNVHTHTTFCDGKHTPAQMAQAAAQKGFSVLGFSGHSMYPFSSEWHIESRRHAEYCAEIARLKREYAGTLDILLGFEADYIPGLCCPSFDRYKSFAPDFLIGSVHFIYADTGMFAVDNTPQELANGVQAAFGGDARAAVCEYFALQRAMLAHGDFTILGHADLIRKFNGQLHLFDEAEPWYKQELRALADAVHKAGVVVEVNTGAIARGYMTDSYPSEQLLSLLYERRVPVTISADAHTAESIDCAFAAAAAKIQKAGYRELAVPAPGSLSFVAL